MCCVPSSFLKYCRSQSPISLSLLSSVSRMVCPVVRIQKYQFQKEFCEFEMCLRTCGTHMFENVFHHYAHTSPLLVVCLWSNTRDLTSINIFVSLSLSLSPDMPVDVHSGTFRLWQIQNGSSFHGCIQNLYINNELQDFTKTQMKPGVVPGCEPCKKIYCLHGICQPDGVQGPVCHCQPGWTGPHCDQPANSPCQGSKYVKILSPFPSFFTPVKIKIKIYFCMFMQLWIFKILIYNSYMFKHL